MTLGAPKSPGPARRRRSVVEAVLKLIDVSCLEEVRRNPRKARRFRTRFFRDLKRGFNRKYHLSVGAPEKDHITEAIKLLEKGRSDRFVENACIKGFEKMSRWRRAAEQKKFWASIKARQKKLAWKTKNKKSRQIN